jgi:hypothetical protein
LAEASIPCFHALIFNDGELNYFSSFVTLIERTYYEPLLVADNGHFLHTSVNAADKVMMEVTFDLQAQKQFDQVCHLIHFVKTMIDAIVIIIINRLG